jgi:hypothetical protein
VSRIESLPSWLKANWFLVAAALVVGSDLVALQVPNWASPRLLEFGLLSDLAIVVPGLYVACYWRKGKQALLRAIALASLGFWSASKLLPESAHFLVQSLWPVRYVALAVLFVVELKVMLAIYRSVFRGASRQEVANSLQSQAGMPAWAASLAAAEAAFWHSAYTKAKAFLQWRRR